MSLTSEVYKYDVSTNTWIQLPAYNGGAIAGQFAVATETRAFSGGGYTGSISARNDVWEFTSATTGINEHSLQKDGVYIYPNPANDFISVKSSNEIASLEGYDVSGKKVFFYNSSFDLIEISNLPAGVYNIRYTFADGKTGSNRFIKTDY